MPEFAILNAVGNHFQLPSENINLPDYGGALFGVDYEPKTPKAGQNVTFWITHTNGMPVADPMGDITFSIDFGDGFAAFGSGAETPSGVVAKNVARGRVFNHTYDGQGLQSVVIRAHRVGRAPVEHTEEITVLDPGTWQDPQSGDVTYASVIYYAQDGVFPAGTPKANGPIHRITTHAELIALANNGAHSDADTWLLFKGGNTTEFGDGTGDLTSTRFQVRGRLRVSPFGTGKAKLIPNFGAATSFSNIFRQVGAGAESSQVVMVDIEVDGLYDPVTGEKDARGHFGVTSIAQGDQSIFSAHRCKFDNCRWIVVCTAVGHDMHVAMSDTTAHGFQDYLVLMANGGGSFSLAGCVMRQNVLATRGDGKKGTAAAIDLPDHGLFRLHVVLRIGAYCCDFFTNVGWTSIWQAIFRINDDVEYGDGLSVLRSFVGNTSLAHVLLQAATTNDMNTPGGTGEVNVDCQGIVEGNYARSGPQCQSALGINYGGYVAQNNVFYLPNLYEIYGQAQFYVVGVTATTSRVSGAAATNKILVRNNIWVSQRSSTSGGTWPVSFFGGMNAGWVNPNLEEYGNILSFDNHGLAGNFASTDLSPGDMFRHLISSSAEMASNDNTVPFDILDNARGATTSDGAFHTGVASVTPVAPPVYTSPPVIGAVPSTGGKVSPIALVGEGDVTGKVTFIRQWRDDGVPIAGVEADDSRLDRDGRTGPFDCNVIATNESGARVGGLSNELLAS